MKILLILCLALSLYGGTTYRAFDIDKYKLSVDIICKNGFLIDVVTGKMDRINIKVEQAHCVDYSEWNKRNCNHSPIKCVKDIE